MLKTIYHAKVLRWGIFYMIFGKTNPLAEFQVNGLTS